MEDISQGADISFFIVVKLTVTGAHVDGLFALSRSRRQLALTLRLLQLLDVLNLSTTAAERRNTATVWVHLGTLLLDQSFQSGDVPSFFDLRLLFQLPLLIGDCVISYPFVFSFFDRSLLLLLQIGGLVFVYGVETSTFSESLQHRELESRIKPTVVAL